MNERAKIGKLLKKVAEYANVKGYNIMVCASFCLEEEGGAAICCSIKNMSPQEISEAYIRIGHALVEDIVVNK